MCVPTAWQIIISYFSLHLLPYQIHHSTSNNNNAAAMDPTPPQLTQNHVSRTYSPLRYVPIANLYTFFMWNFKSQTKNRHGTWHMASCLSLLPKFPPKQICNFRDCWEEQRKGICVEDILRWISAHLLLVQQKNWQFWGLLSKPIILRHSLTPKLMRVTD